MAKKLWGGRFSKQIDPLAEEFAKSIRYDYQLGEWDVFGSIVHVTVLYKAGYLTKGESKSMIAALQKIAAAIRKGKFKFDSKCEDVHTCVQNALERKIGSLVLKLHTARSRNDQVVLATKLYCKHALLSLSKEVLGLIDSINSLSSANDAVILPGFTHMQHAQPVYLANYLGAYYQMLFRDQERLTAISKNMVVSFGAGALAGTPIQRNKYEINAQEVFGSDLKDIGKVFNIKAALNSLDTVSDRDFVIEILSALSIIGMHLSRLAEDLIIWSTKEFDFVEIDEAFCTGSSLMPQKKNADVLELIRGYAGRLYGNLVSVLTMMKGLPLTYNRDMQLDKEPLFNSFEIVSSELKVLSGLMKTLKFNEDKIKDHLKDESLYATDLVYYLVDRGVAFKDAHTIIGKLVKHSLDNSIQIKEMTEPELKKFSDKFVKKEIVKLFDPLVSVKSKKSIKR